ncbi:MAG: hypothetical protein JWO92_1932 [Chitinophagaceae bacterium]|nr:hypothetical protein [Chitinophagaceae bacterium]
MRTNYKWTKILGTITPILILACVFLMGGGHGWYTPTFIIFPWASFNVIWQDHLSIPLLLLGIFQFVIYGLLMDRSKTVNTKRNLIAILLIHIILVILIISFKNSEWR